MGKEPFYWLTTSYAGVFDDIHIKNDNAVEKDLEHSLYFSKEEEDDAKHLKFLIMALIKANYPRAKDWYKELPRQYQDLITRLKIDKTDIRSRR